MTLLAIIQEFCRRTGLPAPAVVFSSQDDQVLQLAALANEVMTHLAEYQWQENIAEATWAATATENQGALTTLAPGYVGMVQGTLWNRTTRRNYNPCLNPRDWQALKAMPLTGYYNYRLIGGDLHLVQPPAAADSMAFEYYSANLVRDSLGVAKALFTADADTSPLPDSALLLGLRWVWKKEKGLPYAEEFMQWQTHVANLLNRNTGGNSLRMDGQTRSAVPGIIIPAGSWSP